MRLHPTFYVGLLKPYVQHESSTGDDSLEGLIEIAHASDQSVQSRPETGRDVRSSLRSLRSISTEDSDLLLQSSHLGALRLLERRNAIGQGPIAMVIALTIRRGCFRPLRRR